MKNNEQLKKLYQSKVDDLKKDGLFNTIRVLEKANQPRTIIDGRKILNFNSNNFLDFANDPKVKAAAKKAIDDFGVGPGAVRSISGSNSLHQELEARIAKFKGSEDALVVQSGFIANTAFFPTMFGPNDCIISDALNHASIIDAIRLGKANKKIYKHSDMEDLEIKLKEANAEFSGLKIIVTDGVFSMDGEICNLPEIKILAQKYDALIAIDDAWGELGLGKTGRGTPQHYGIDVDFEIGSLSKGFGVQGGFICGSKEVINFLRQRSRPFLFSTGLGVPECGAAIEVLKQLEVSTNKITTLHKNVKYFQKGIAKLGFSNDSETQIQPVFTGDEFKAQEMSKQLFKNGVFVTPIVFPTVPKGTARCRFIISAAHTKQDLDECLTIIEEVAKDLELI